MGYRTPTSLLVPFGNRHPLTSGSIWTWYAFDGQVLLTTLSCRFTICVLSLLTITYVSDAKFTFFVCKRLTYPYTSSSGTLAPHLSFYLDVLARLSVHLHSSYSIGSNKGGTRSDRPQSIRCCFKQSSTSANFKTGQPAAAFDQGDFLKCYWVCASFDERRCRDEAILRLAEALDLGDLYFQRVHRKRCKCSYGLILLFHVGFARAERQGGPFPFVSLLQIIEGESQSLLLRFRNELISFEDLIEAHSTSLDRMIELCFLGDERDGSEGPSAAIREALLCIMELASKAADAFAVYTGEARERPIKTEERERKRRRRERKKKQKKELGRKSSRWSGLRDEDDDDEEEEEGEEGGAAEQQQQHHIKGFRKEMDDKEERPGIGDVSYAGMTTFNTTFSTFFEEDEDVGESFLDFVRRVDAKLDGALATIRRKLGLLIARASAASKHDDREALQNLAFALEG